MIVAGNLVPRHTVLWIAAGSTRADGQQEECRDSIGKCGETNSGDLSHGAMTLELLRTMKTNPGRTIANTSNT